MDSRVRGNDDGIELPASGPGVAPKDAVIQEDMPDG
jgi:hypothetical protein